MSYTNLYLHHFPFRKEAQLDEEGQFLVRIIYEDSKTYDLVAAASKVLSRFNVGQTDTDSQRTTAYDDASR